MPKPSTACLLVLKVGSICSSNESEDRIYGDTFKRHLIGPRMIFIPIKPMPQRRQESLDLIPACLWISYSPSSNIAPKHWCMLVQKISDSNFPIFYVGCLWGSHLMVIPYVNVDKWFRDNNVGFYRVKPYKHFVQHSIAVVVSFHVFQLTSWRSWNPIGKFSA